MRYAFADCVLDTENYTLTRNGAPVSVEPQVFDLLALLAMHAGKLVSRDQLVENVWNGRIVSEATIAARINAARRAVGDDGKSQAVIRTIPRRGIELTAQVETQSGDAARPSPESPTGNQTVRYTTSADGTQIAYALSGNGPMLLRAAHHVTHLELDWNSRFWRPGFDALGQQHRLIRYDIRGTGLSDDASADDNIEHHVDDLAAVADANGLDRFPIFANLNSAAVAIRFAAEQPDRVSRLVIQEGYARGRAMRHAEGENWSDPFVSLLREGGWGQSDSGYMRAWISIAVPDLSYDDATELIELISGACSTENALSSRQVIDRYDVREHLGAVQTPTLVIHCRSDTLHPMTEGRLIAAGIPNAEFHVVESANTLCLAPDPTWAEQFDAILGFLREN
jgi:DNA-binding winged helix-turn-helix (wHTH) protein